MNKVDLNLLMQIAGLREAPKGAFNLRKNSMSESCTSSQNIEIKAKTEQSGIDIHVKPGTKNEDVHIPVIITESGLNEMVYNDFYIGADCDINIVAGCGIHNDGPEGSQHNGIHTFYVGKNSRMRYTEKHYGEGAGAGERIMNPQTVVYLDEGAFVALETIQIKGIDSTKRYTKVVLGKNTETIITEKLLTHGNQIAISEMDVILDGENSNARIISRSVAQDSSKQTFYPRMIGNAKCFGHVQCDSIIMGNANIRSIPEISANNMDAQLIHEAAIGRIAGDQIVKLMTLGLTEQEAEDKILSGFLK